MEGTACAPNPLSDASKHMRTYKFCAVAWSLDFAGGCTIITETCKRVDDAGLGQCTIPLQVIVEPSDDMVINHCHAAEITCCAHVVIMHNQQQLLTLTGPQSLLCVRCVSKGPFATLVAA